MAKYKHRILSIVWNESRKEYIFTCICGVTESSIYWNVSPFTVDKHGRG